MTSRRCHQGGFTLVETVIALLVGSIVMWAMTSLLGTTGELTETSRINTRAYAEHRRNLESLSTVVREMDNRTLTEDAGFDMNTGLATEPLFQRVTGLGQVVTLNDQEQLVWRRRAFPVNGVPNPGAVWLVGPSSERLVADKVPEGGFSLRRQIVPLPPPVDPKDPHHPEAKFGPVLTIRLTTYYATDADKVTSVTSETGVVLRNFFVLSEGK